MKGLYTMVGMQHHRGAAAAVRKMRGGEQLELRREPDNPHDRNAVQVWGFTRPGGQMLAYVKATEAKELAPRMDAAGAATCLGRLVHGEWPQVETDF